MTETVGFRTIPQVNWPVASAAALAVLAVDSSDVGKVAYQIDTGDFYWLIDSTPRWHLLASRGVYNVKSFGARGDGVTDDRAAIQAAIDAASLLGGLVLLPAGSYYLGSLSTDSNAYTSFLTPKDNVHIVGEGKGVTTLLVGTNWKTLVPNGGNTGPMVFGLNGRLSNASFRSLTIDWNGAILGSGDTRRNFAGIFTFTGAFRCEVIDVEFLENPGNQCVFFRATSNTGQGFNTIERCDFVDCGSSLAGNYNYDHSSVFMYGYGNVYRQNRFTTTGGIVYGAPFELHGSYSKAIGNYVEGYQICCWLGADYEDLDAVLVEDNDFVNVEYGPQYSAVTYKFGVVSILRNRITAGDPNDFAAYGSGVASDGVVFAGGAKISCDELRFEDNVLTGVFGSGAHARDCYALQVNLTKRAFIRGNTFRQWSRRAISHGGTALPSPDGSYIAHEIDISDNTFEDCIQTAYISGNNYVINVQATQGIKSLRIADNAFVHNTSEGVAPLNVSCPIDAGHIVDNNVDPNMTLSLVLGTTATDVFLRHAQELAPGTSIRCALGSTWTNLITGERSTKEAASTAWVGNSSPVDFHSTIAMTAASGTPAVGDGVLRSWYLKSGSLVTFQISLQVGSTTTFGTGELRFSLPFTPTNPPIQSLSARLYDTSANTYYTLSARVQQSVAYLSLAADGVAGTLTGTSPITLATGDLITVTGSYIL